METAFDVHRFALYRALARPLPTGPADERQLGRALTVDLLRGAQPDGHHP